MHYGDKEQIENNLLVVVVYKHSHSIENMKNEFIYDLKSIQQCQYFTPSILKKILYMDKEWSHTYFNKILDSYPVEHYYKITIKELGRNELIDYEKYRNYKGKVKFSLIPDNVSISIEDVNESENEFYRLH